MPRHQSLSSFILLVAVAACTAPGGAPPATPVDQSVIQDEIAAREREWSAAFLAGDAAGVANLYAEDGAQIEATGDWRRGREAITMGMKAQLDTLNVTAREDITEEVIVAGDYVVEFGHYSFTATSKTGNQPVSGAGRYVVIWRKDADGVWRLFRDLGNDAPKM